MDGGWRARPEDSGGLLSPTLSDENLRKPSSQYNSGNDADNEAGDAVQQLDTVSEDVVRPSSQPDVEMARASSEGAISPPLSTPSSLIRVPADENAAAVAEEDSEASRPFEYASVSQPRTPQLSSVTPVGALSRQRPLYPTLPKEDDSEKKPLLTSSGIKSYTIEKDSFGLPYKIEPQYPTKKKKVLKYYRQQNELLEKYRRDELVLELGYLPEEDNDSKAQLGRILSVVVLLVNVALLIGKGIALGLAGTNSLTILTSLIDSLFDLLSGAIMWYIAHKILHTNYFDYPRGRQNLEICGAILVSAAMCVGNLWIVLQSVLKFFGEPQVIDVSFVVLGIMACTCAVKLVLFFICKTCGGTTGETLAVDQRNDAVMNFFTALGVYFSQFNYFVDPAVAACVASAIIVIWILHMLKEIPKLVGVSASPEEISRAVLMCLKIHKRVLMMDAFLAYHLGEKVRVEAHVLLDENTPISVVNRDVGDPLKEALENLDFVDVAYIHPDDSLDFISGMSEHPRRMSHA